MLLFSPTWLFLMPGFALMLLGSGFGIRLILGPLKVGVFGFDTNTLLVCSMAVILGLQVCLFGLFTRLFATTEGLLPQQPVVQRLSSLLTLERGLVLGLLLFGFGVAQLGAAFLYWQAASFGSISYPDSLRKVIPAVTLITLGVQVVFSSFFLSILSLPRK